VTCERRRAKFA